jgi:hypothetical protein
MKPSDELEQLLKNLHLNRILDIYSEQLSAAEKEDVSESAQRTPSCSAEAKHLNSDAWTVSVG